MGPSTPYIEDNSDEAVSDGYQKALKELIEVRGMNPRKARRYLDSIARKKVKKIMKNRTKK